MQHEEKFTCPSCHWDSEVKGSVWSSIFEKHICFGCYLEIGLEFQQGFGHTYTEKAVMSSGLDILEVKKRYLLDIMKKIEEMLAGELGKNNRQHREWNQVECGKQLHAITSYQQNKVDGDKESVVTAKNDLDKIMETTAFGIDLLLGGSINHLTD